MGKNPKGGAIRTICWPERKIGASGIQKERNYDGSKEPPLGTKVPGGLLANGNPSLTNESSGGKIQIQWNCDLL